MTIAIGILNLVLGTVYFQYGSMTVVDMRRNWSSKRFSHFGAAWIAMAFTCGPHHFAHGLHLLTSNASAGPLDLVVVLVGFPAGVAWFLLRVEAFRGGRGDRFISGTPRWVLALPTLAAVYATTILMLVIQAGTQRWAHLQSVTPNLLLIVIYGMIGCYLARTQIANRRPLGGFSVSGLALTVVFPTCALMHAVFAYYTLTGRYGVVAPTLTIDWLAVPAGVYFLWVVQALYRGSYRDWNSAKTMRTATVVPAAVDTAPSVAPAGVDTAPVPAR